jgi:hypothetical protein
MSRHTDKPMARAQAHLAAGHHSEAIGAFRAVLGIDPSMISARLGLAEALAARGQRGVAVEGLVEAAERCEGHGQHADALALYGKALALDPARVELHLGMAVVEHAMGRAYAAVARVEELAERYMGMGRTDEAAELLRFAAAWEEEDDELDEAELVEELDEATVVARNPLLSERPSRAAPRVQTETVVCATVLVRPDGSLWFGNGARPGAPEVDEAELTVARAVSAPIVLDDMVTRVASSASKPASPARAGGTAAMVAGPVVDRLRRRAGLGPEATAVPRSTKGQGTEPIVIRRPNLGRPEREREDEVTHRFRHPRGSLRAATH